MIFNRIFFTTLIAFSSVATSAGTPTVGESLPALIVEERGEIIYQAEEDDFSFQTWRSDTNPGKVHVIQYFGATMGDSKIFEPLTDMLQTSVPAGSVHVSTVINLDAAMWGTTGFVVSEIKKNKRQHSTSTIVLEKDGTGVELWQLGKDGAGLIILDSEGIVRHFATNALSEEQLTSTLALIKSLMGDG